LASLLHPDIEKFIGAQLEGGEFHSPDEVVTEALFRLWQRQQDQVATHTSTPPGSRQKPGGQNLGISTSVCEPGWCPSG
jgi:Arc/MetJ-type ribon-helix-helix transcriptional regulator